MRSSQEKEDEIKKTDVDDAQWSRSRTYPILRSPKRQGKLFTPLQWSAARIVEQVVNAVQSAVNPVCKFTQTKNPSSDVGEKEIENPDEKSIQ